MKLLKKKLKQSESKANKLEAKEERRLQKIDDDREKERTKKAEKKRLDKIANGFWSVFFQLIFCAIPLVLVAIGVHWIAGHFTEVLYWAFLAFVGIPIFIGSWLANLE